MNKLKKTYLLSRCTLHLLVVTCLNNVVCSIYALKIGVENAASMLLELVNNTNFGCPFGW